MSKKLDIKGIIPPVVTLINKDKTLDEQAMAHHIDNLIENRVNGLFFMGTGGEFAQMSVALRKQTAEVAVRETAGRVPVLIGTGAAGYEETKELSLHAEEIGADAIVVINPYYWNVSEDHLFSYYKSLAEEVNLPIILYNFPGTTGQDLTPDFVSKLAEEIPSIIGVKETVDEAGHIREMIIKTKEVRSDFIVLSGYDDHLLNTLTLGGDGAISAGVNFAPELQVGIYEAFQKNDFETAIQLHRQNAYIPLMYKLDTPFVNVIKEAMILRGKNIEPYVFGPGDVLGEHQRQELKNLMKLANISAKMLSR
ncbi:dihydrodipicolinate synthase family protein [Salibacterium salarium]|uniref:Dihydrodipicolinate synthase family protein n=1 Tax=Salibacterium salarium TaxID=284579 RepID=A0A3R9RF62_9BACI|nr:dihydrodipicolinate synthase family protein [Salibacterium salarium]RSL34077.1 dihydrodipicolinate synthase family protein [Salibacterium salarium]